MTTLAKVPVDVVKVAALADNWRTRLVLPLKLDEGPLEVLTLKMPAKLKARVDAAAKATGNNRSQTMLALMRWALDQFEAQRAEEMKKSKK